MVLRSAYKAEPGRVTAVISRGWEPPGNTLWELHGPISLKGTNYELQLTMETNKQCGSHKVFLADNQLDLC